MKNTIVFFLLLMLSTLLFYCKDKPEVCACSDNEDCVDGECLWKPNYYRVGGVGVIGHDLYVGIVEDNFCLDTLIFNIRENGEFSLFMDVPPMQNIGINVNYQRSDTEFILGHGSHLCYDDGLIYSDIICKTYVPDSVSLTFLFWHLESPGVYIDTAHVTMVKHR
ncbi:MAG: hypothetical protein R2795_22835 [Saprospiraceae bacterium]